MRVLRRDYDFGSILLGSLGENERVLRIRLQILISLGVLIPNAIGAGLAILIATVGVRKPSMFQVHLWWINFLVLPIYVGAAFVIGQVYGMTTVMRRLRWSRLQQVPTAADGRYVMRIPMVLARLQLFFWLIAVVLFTTLYGLQDWNMTAKVGFATGISAIVVSVFSYLLVEFALRPLAAQVLEVNGPSVSRRSGLRVRTLVTWAVGTGLPLIGIILTAALSYAGPRMSRSDLAVAMLGLAGIALGTSLILTMLSTGSIVDPIRSVKSGMKRVSKGDNNVHIAVYDGSELGELQEGFNSMVAGLAERERMRDLFGRHVGREVAEAALDQKMELGGSERLVAVIFVDVIGSTALAQQRSPAEVVAILNRFFAVVVNSISRHGGLVNKFEGDAVLAIFGAPVTVADAAGSALAAAREITDELGIKVPELQAGVGVAYGPAVAGNVGAIERFEYTVIGDPVNEGARLSEVAKSDPGRPLASGRAIAAAAPEEARFWERLDTITLRGRTDATEVYGPRRA